MKKRIFGLALLIAFIMMGSAYGATKQVRTIKKVWKSGKNFITITFAPYKTDLNTVRFSVTFNGSKRIASDLIHTELRTLSNKVVWSKKGDFAAIYYHSSYSDTSLLVYDVKSGKTTNLFELLPNHKIVLEESYHHIVDMSKVRKYKGICLGRIFARMHDSSKDNPSLSITPAGDIKYFIDYSKRGYAELKSEDIPVACRIKGGVVIDTSVVEEIVQKRTGEVVSSKLYYTEDSYAEPEDPNHPEP
jgi:hypothetical protein